MLRNKKLSAMISFIMTIVLLATGLCPFYNAVPLEAAGSDDETQISASTPGEEIISERTESSKTYYLEDGSYAQDIYIGAIHYKDNYADDSEQWKDIDLTFDENNQITTAPYILTVDTENYSITVKDKMTGQVSALKLIQIGDKDIADISKTAVTISKDKIQWDDVATDLDLAITPENGRVNFDWVVKSEDAPHAVTFELEDGGIPIAYKGVDAEGEAVEVTAVSDGDKVTETIEKGGNYPKIINPTLNLQVSINYITDDIHVWRTGTTWTAGLYDTDLYIGRLTSTNNRHGMGLRFRNATIPAGAYITTAYLDLCAGFDYTTVPFYARIVGDLESSAATFSTIANYQSRRGTSAGGSNDNKRTTAEVDWDSSETWTMDEWYETPEIKTVVQEIVDQTGWSSGNAMALFCDDHDYRDTSSGRKRSCYAADAADPVKLHIEYTTDFYYNGMYWSAGSATYNLSSVDNSTWRAAINSAASAWNGAGANFSFTNDSNSSHNWTTANRGTNYGQIMISSWGWSGDSIVSCGTEINTYYTWSTDGSAFDIQSVACHEFGHWLSLGHVSTTSAIMNGGIASGEIKRTLTTGDINGIKYIYP